MARPQFAFSRTYLYLLVFTVIAAGLTLLLVDMTGRTYSFTAEPMTVEQAGLEENL